MIQYAITLHQPWATMIAGWPELDTYVAGGGSAILPKRIENRTWDPPEMLKGAWLAIHAGKQFDQDGALDISIQLTSTGLGLPERMPAGAVVAVARVAGTFFQVDFFQVDFLGEVEPRWGFDSWWSAIRPDAAAPGKLEHLPATPQDVVADPKRYWLTGPYGWALADVVRLASPVAARGAQKVWNLPTDVAQAVEEQARLAGWQP